VTAANFTSACGQENLYAAALAEVRASGVVPVFAAGNEAYLEGTFTPGVAFPSCTPGAVVVSSVYDSDYGKQTHQEGKRRVCTDTTTRRDQVVCAAQGGSLVDVFAPGANIRTAGRVMTGTSFAAPHVAGTVAALASVRWGASVDQLATAATFSRSVISDRRGPATIVTSRLDMVDAIDKLTELTAPPPPVNVGTEKMRVGYEGTITLPQIGSSDVVSLDWTSLPLTGAYFYAASYTWLNLNSRIYWTPASAGTYPYSVREAFMDGSYREAVGAVAVYPVPAKSLAVSEYTQTYDADPEQVFGGPGIVIEFNVTKSVVSDTTPSRWLKTLEDPASEQFSYESGDSNGNEALDVDEAWHYKGRLWNSSWWPTETVDRTIAVTANDSTGAPGFLEVAQRVAITRP